MAGWEIAAKRVLITGGTAGIGKATAAELARRGAEVVITGRDPDRSAAALAEVRAAAGTEGVECMALDLSSLKDVKRFAAEFRARYDRLDVLVNNAGLVLFGDRAVTDDGFEMMFGVNHLGHFVLTNELTPLLVASAPARVVVVTSGGYRMAREGLDWDDLQHERGEYKAFDVYGHSKLCNNYFTFELARRLAGTGVTANAVHPGYVKTELGRTRGEDRARRVAAQAAPAAGPGAAAAPAAGRNGPSKRPDLSAMQPVTPEEGAACSIYVAASPEVEGITGEYFDDCKVVKTGPISEDPDAARRLWEVSEQLVAEALDRAG